MSNTPEKVKRTKVVSDYFKNVRAEIRKVIWPTRHELISFTGVVLFTCAVFGIGIWVVDSIFSTILQAVFKINL